MFNGIIEAIGIIKEIKKERENKHFTIYSPLAKELSIDQSIAHNGACLTVTGKAEKAYTVTAIAETLAKTNLGTLKDGDKINLERSLSFNGRIDGHLVQGHVDTTGKLISKTDKEGSWELQVSYPAAFNMLLVEKGSICLNGVSLTVFNVKSDQFSVAIIPYTYEHTNLKELKPGGRVNLEFDMIGKYVAKQLARKGER